MSKFGSEYHRIRVEKRILTRVISRGTGIPPHRISDIEQRGAVVRDDIEAWGLIAALFLPQDEAMRLYELSKADRDEWYRAILEQRDEAIARAERAEAKLARVEAECDRLAELSRGASFALDWEEAERLGAIGKAADVIRKALNETEAGDADPD